MPVLVCKKMAQIPLQIQRQETLRTEPSGFSYIGCRKTLSLQLYQAVIMLVTDLLDIDSRAELYQWFVANHNKAKEFWIRVNRSHVVCPGVIKYEDAVEVALCFGWIDSTLKRIDSGKPAQRFSPRRKGSNWCSRNIDRCRRLINQGEMTESGLAVLPKDTFLD